MAEVRVFGVLAVLALLAQGSLAIICNECRTAGAAGSVDYCADPNADTLVACPRTENVCYSTLALISNRIVISRGCGRPLSLPASANLAVNTCRAFGDLSATAIFCVCDSQGGCNNQTAASPDVQRGLQSIAAVQPQSNNIDDRQSRNLVPGQVSSSATIITPAQSSVQVLVPQNNQRAIYVVRDSNAAITTTTTTTEAPQTEAPVVEQQPATAAAPQQIQVLVPNSNTRPVYIVRPNSEGGNTTQILYPGQTNQGTVVVTEAPAATTVQSNNVAAIRNPIIISQLVPGVSNTGQTSNDAVPTNSNNNNGTVIVVNGNENGANTESNMADMVRARGTTSATTMSPSTNTTTTTIVAVIENGTIRTTAANAAVSNYKAFSSGAIIMALSLAIASAISV